MPKESQAKFKDTKKPKLGDAPGRHPLFRLQSIGNITWSYIFIHHMICVLLRVSCIVGVFSFFCCVTIILAAHLLGETRTHRDFARMLIVLHLYLLS